MKNRYLYICRKRKLCDMSDNIEEKVKWLDSLKGNQHLKATVDYLYRNTRFTVKNNGIQRERETE